jgi:hypothetical protein
MKKAQDFILSLFFVKIRIYINKNYHSWVLDC